MLSRRQFLQTSSLVSLSPFVPSMLGNAAHAASAAPDAKVLVVIQLDGGNDGINTVVPYGDDAYGRVRKKLRLQTGKLHKLNDHVGLHPNMGAAKELFDDGRLTIVQGVGYPNPDRSHFRSMKIWQTARFDEDQHDGYGWLGRALDQRSLQQSVSTTANAIYVGDDETPVALWGRRSAAMSLSRADDLKLQIELAPLTSSHSLQSSPSALHQFVSRQVLSAYAAADEFHRQQVRKPKDGGASFPNTKLGSRLKLISQLLQSGSQARVFYTMQSGYDTHSAQLYTHARLLRGFSTALRAFLNDLRTAKLDDRVIVLGFSEFGRRVKENDSQGTDHGTAGPVFVAGQPVKGGLIGGASDLSDLDGGDLKMQLDFRQVYAPILDKWLRVPSADILGSPFDALPIFEA